VAPAFAVCWALRYVNVVDPIVHGPPEVVNGAVVEVVMNVVGNVALTDATPLNASAAFAYT